MTEFLPLISSSFTFLLGIIALIGVVVMVHEGGHFIVARMCNIAVLEYSLGFGPKLFSWRSKSGIDYCVRAIPLGGFVRMLDKSDLPPKDQIVKPPRYWGNGLVYQDAPFGSRIATLLAGPLANFVLTFFIFWGLFIAGVPGIVPKVGDVRPDSPVAEAGMRIDDVVLSLDGQKIQSFDQLGILLIGHLGETDKTLSMGVERGGFSAPLELRVPLTNWDVREAEQDPLGSLGLILEYLRIPPRFGEVRPGSPAEQVGLQGGDLVLSLGDEPINSWQRMRDVVAASPGESLPLVVEREGEALSVTVVPDAVASEQGDIGVIGVTAADFTRDSQLRIQVQHSIPTAFVVALTETWRMITLTVDGLFKLITGLLSPELIAGPVGLAKIAGDAAVSSAQLFARVIAIISVGIGIANLLPLPPLDGGRIVLHIFEAVKGSELSNRALLGVQVAGSAVVFLVIIFATYQDILRLL